MHTYNDEKEHLKVMIIEHSKAYDIYMKTVLKESKVQILHITTVMNAAHTVLK